MILNQNQSNYTTFLGWYGNCDTDCQPFDIKAIDTNDVIFSVYQFGETGEGVFTYNYSAPSFLNSFTKLECGKAYWVVLNPGTSSINLPDFTVSSNKEENYGLITDICPSAEPTPTPLIGDEFVSKPNGRFKFKINNTSGNSTYDDAKYKKVFIDAFNRWDEIITEVPVYEDGTNLQMYITVDFKTLEPGVLGSASPTRAVLLNNSWDFGNVYVTEGQFQLSTTYMGNMYDNILEDGKNEMYYVSLHEIGHIIGIGPVNFSSTQVTNKPVVDYVDSDDGKMKKYYTGFNALREYRNYFSHINGLVGIPIEDDGGPGTALGHPEEGNAENHMGIVSQNDRRINGVFHPGLEHELMTGWSDANRIPLPLSRVTIAFLEDLGYGVDYSKADDYDVSGILPELPFEPTPTPTPTSTLLPTPISDTTYDPIGVETPTPTNLINVNFKKKILALHGGGETANSFRNQSGVISLINSLSNYEFVFADAPSNNLWIQDPPGGKDYPTSDPNWANDSINYLDNLISQHGPFDGILGYSQGAAFIPVYLSNTSNQFKFASMYNGYLPYTHTGLMQIINSNSPFNIPSVVFSGEYDYAFKNMAPDLASKFENSLQYKSSVAGHHLPFSSDPVFYFILEFIKNID